MTLFSPKSWCTRVVTGADVKYENGAVVKTSFVSNMFGDIEIFASPELGKLIAGVQKSPTTSLPKYKYPENIITVSRICSLVNKGVSVVIPRQKVMKISTLLSQRRSKSPGIFGGGYLVSDSIAKELAIKEIVVKEIAIEWPLMDQEKLVIQQLDASM